MSDRNFEHENENLGFAAEASVRRMRASSVATPGNDPGQTWSTGARADRYFLADLVARPTCDNPTRPNTSSTSMTD